MNTTARVTADAGVLQAAWPAAFGLFEAKLCKQNASCEASRPCAEEAKQGTGQRCHFYACAACAAFRLSHPAASWFELEAAEEGGGKNHSWDAWVAGLAVLVTATSDPQNAAYCVSYFDAHLAVSKFLGLLFMAMFLLDASLKPLRYA